MSHRLSEVVIVDLDSGLIYMLKFVVESFVKSDEHDEAPTFDRSKLLLQGV